MAHVYCHYRLITHEVVTVEIPITAISLQDGLNLLENGLGLKAILNVKTTGVECDIGCSDSIACPLGQYCDYAFETHGYCQECLSNEDEQRVVVRIC